MADDFKMTDEDDFKKINIHDMSIDTIAKIKLELDGADASSRKRLNDKISAGLKELDE